MRKLVEKLSMTRRWATDSRHITHRGGMYWSYSSTQRTCSSAQGEGTCNRMLTYEHDNEDAKEDPEDVAQDVHHDDRDEGDGKAHLPLALLTLATAQNLSSFSARDLDFCLNIDSGICGSDYSEEY